jgi:hypothetical protein
MNINKAIRKQKKTYKRFMLSMGFIFVLLPIILITSKITSIFFVIYLCCMELLISFVVIYRIDEEYIDFKQDGYHISIWCGIAKAKFVVTCKKVALVHTEGQDKNLEIIIITKSRFRNKKINPVAISFLKKYPYVAYMYNRIKIENPEEEYFYFIIKNGGFRKYILLDDLYKSSVQAVFSDDAIERIKEYREYSINPHIHK